MLKITPGPQLRERTTLRLGGRARAEVLAEREQDLLDLPSVLAELNAAPLVLGRGSNILALDGELPCALVATNFGPAPEIAGQEDGLIVVRVGAGFALPRFLLWCAKRGLRGLEGLAGIPGTVGGAVAMNAGSYGCETGHCLRGVRLYAPDWGLAEFARDSLEFAYRRFRPMKAGCPPPDWFVVTQAWFGFERGEPEAVRKAMEEHLRRKAATQPLRASSAGCVFKNPGPGLSAGKLLDEAGFKGKRRGAMMFSDLHANFLVNTGGGNSDDAMGLLEEARRAVYEQSGHKLAWEVRVYPDGQYRQ